MSPQIKRVLIANRGAIAVRIIRTLNQMGIESIAVYSDADRESLHVRKADHAYSLGDGNAAETYLDQAKILQIANQANADAIHPGYGFLSENTEFVALCEHKGIAFFGPTAEQISAFGLKHKARELAQQSKTPLLPGSGILNNVEAAIEQAERIVYPVMLKSTAGGGGIGMQLCRDQNDLKNAWVSVSKLSENNFSNADLFIEKFIESARHIEVQIFGDGQGGVVAIGERDCSAQRRNQKVLEETPAPNISVSLRQDLHRSAVELMCSIGYRSAGTVEFILDADTQKFYFLEVNTRLQVEHGVTEEVYGIDIVRCMIELADGKAGLIERLSNTEPNGHAIQARVYAEDPARNFKPSAGLLSKVEFPAQQTGALRIDTWVESGLEISPFYDPMLAKVIAVGGDRREALNRLHQALQQTHLYGVETNIDFLKHLLKFKPFVEGLCLTASLKNFHPQTRTIEVVSAGTMTTIQDFPGRVGYWNVGVPPSGPFDNVGFRLANRLLGNSEDAAGLEMTINGAHLKFEFDCQVVLVGAQMTATVNGETVKHSQPLAIKQGQVLRVGSIASHGARTYLAIEGGLSCPEYLGSRSTFTLGQFGGHAGRALRVGDVLHVNSQASIRAERKEPLPFQQSYQDFFKHEVKQVRVIAGPQGAPDYFAEEYIDTFFETNWEVHYNSSRTGVRLIGPKPIWTRDNGGEAGLHPSNIHDNAYAVGTIDFTGDMPVILGPDGPSLGGFVCPATVITADFWMIGQLAAGDKVQFIPVTQESAVAALSEFDPSLERRVEQTSLENETQIVSSKARKHFIQKHELGDTALVFRQSGDSYLLVEYGDHVLDIELRFKVHQLMLSLNQAPFSGIIELTPGIRSLQVHYDVRTTSFEHVIEHVLSCAKTAMLSNDNVVDSRIVHLPMSWDDPQCQLAIEKYDQSVRKNAPWYPSNIEFIRRINGLKDIESVKRIIFDANYLVMGLGDVYLGAPVATPVDPGHRLVTTKYNPARTWTAENSVGIGGSYLCVYGMEGPGGYQFVGRTLQMWNRYRETTEFTKPWLLRFFDQIKFYPVSSQELEQIRKGFLLGEAPIKIEQTKFSLEQYKRSLEENKPQIDGFVEKREMAFNGELTRWKQQGQYHFEQEVPEPDVTKHAIPEGCASIDSPVSGSLWEHQVHIGDSITEGEVVSIVESMKMEVQVTSPVSGVVSEVLIKQGEQIAAGNPVMVIKPSK